MVIPDGIGYAVKIELFIIWMLHLFLPAKMSNSVQCSWLFK